MAHKFAPSAVVERRYGVALRKVSRMAARMILAHVTGHTLRDQQQLFRLLHAYTDSLGPWAEHLAAAMMAGVSASNAKAFAATSRTIGKELKQVSRSSSIGHVAQLLQSRQVELITSIPLQAGLRAQELSQQALRDGRRASEVAEELLRTEEVTESRATLIARTEIAKANAALTQARADSIGVNQYRWETAQDADVRESHREMQGTIQSFDDPPTLSDGMTGNPGEFPNCRCFAVPLIDEG